MGFWSSFRRSSAPKDEAVSTPSAAAPLDAPAPIFPAGIVRLLTFGDATGPGEDEAAALFADARRTSHEGMAVDHLMQAHAAAHLPDRLAIAVASALLARGERASAKTLLATTNGLAALILSADLLAEDGDFAGAVATIERALLRDLDAPGAGERRVVWRARLGLTDSPSRSDAATETVAVAKAKAPFDLLQEIGRGGAGVVYTATDRELGRRVALKMYHRPDRDRAQLLHEARVASGLEGAGIVRVFDIEPEEGWLALEWAPMGALRDQLRSPEGAVLVPFDAWLPKLARALARVHTAGWVHLDVKPANVLVAAGPNPILSDFGNARRIGEPSPPGSLGYVSPERLAGQASDPRDDVYAFGRVVEDVILAMPDADASFWRTLATQCVGPADARPRDGAAVLRCIDARPRIVNGT